VLQDEAPRWAVAQEALTALQSVADEYPDAALIDRLCAAPLAHVLRDAAQDTFAHASAAMPLWVDRAGARHANWYELFPRSQSPVAGCHGTFEDVIRRLPDIRALGFDVLYLPPIHPIGRQNRKGRNNSLEAAPGDVGSPYAIGSAAGGHDAVDPDLGTLADFERLVAAARQQGLEIALDFAIQCAPDHPWLRRHRDWFNWRPDGSLHHAENPPKKYQDIVNVAFFTDTPPWRRKTALWRALRDIVQFWIARGVRIFRVDNPHTKPLPFWQWLIADIHASDPDVLFLSEAFTRPAMMYRLAKAGFTQSYTYFTWRNTVGELDAYFRELAQPPTADFFRPMLFPSTPDINPRYLQQHGRPGFLVRAVLAATGSGLWGIYNGFELCEAAPLPGTEEHADSEKYELRQRDLHAPGNIRAEIAQLNAIRRANPALQDHRGFHALACSTEGVLAYVRHSPLGSSVLLIIVNLEPERSVDVAVCIEPVTVAENLLTGAAVDWPDGWARARLYPDAPYGIWRLPVLPFFY
jgi:starch synthase (maltosyl-transferring)